MVAGLRNWRTGFGPGGDRIAIHALAIPAAKGTTMSFRAIWSAFLIVAMLIAAPCRAWGNDDVGHDVGENVAATGCMEVMAAEKRQEKSPLSDQHSSKAAMACHTNCALATATVGAKAASYHAALQNDLPAIPIGPGQAVQPPTPPPRSARVEAYDIII